MLLYVLGVLLIGIPILIGELMLGKVSGTGIWLAERKLRRSLPEAEHAEPERSFLSLSSFVLGSCFLVTCYYAVVSGWVLHFLMQTVFGKVGASGESIDLGLAWLKQNGSMQVALVGVHLAVCLVVVSRGVQEGIERWVGSIMPLFFVLLVVLVTKSLETGQVEDAFRYLFYPDFSKLSLYSPIYAVGHVLFTLSVGLGTMVTFGSYLRKESNVPSAALRVATLDTGISLVAGVLVFPTIIGMSLVGSGPELLFRAVPRLLKGIEFGWFFGVSFFLCLYLAAVGASIGLLETLVSNFRDRWKISRWAASWWIGFAALLGSSVPALSSSLFSDFSVFGRPLLVAWDAIVVNVLMPVGVLFMSWLMGHRVSPESANREFANDESLITQSLYPYWRWAMKWLVPAIIVASFILAGLALIRDFGYGQVGD